MNFSGISQNSWCLRELFGGHSHVLGHNVYSSNGHTRLVPHEVKQKAFPDLFIHSLNYLIYTKLVIAWVMEWEVVFFIFRYFFIDPPTPTLHYTVFNVCQSNVLIKRIYVWLMNPTHAYQGSGTKIIRTHGIILPRWMGRKLPQGSFVFVTAIAIEL